MTGRKHTTAISIAGILGNAHISESPAHLEQLPPQIRSVIDDARIHGYRPVCIYWPDGKTAFTFIPAKATLPAPEQIITAYRQCEKTDKVLPEGDLS